MVSAVWPRQEEELLACGAERGALPACSSVEKRKLGFCESAQTRNPNHNMVITLQLFGMK